MINKNPFLAILNLKTNGVLPRVCTWGCFKTKETGKSFYVVNTHLDHQYDQARINQLQTIITTMNTYLKDNEAPVFFMGDFNTPMSESMQQVIPMFENSKAIACQDDNGPGVYRYQLGSWPRAKY